MSRVALVTGASRGIGAATAKKLWTHRDGPDELVLIARDSEDFVKVGVWLTENNHNGRKFSTFDIDVGRLAILPSLLEEIVGIHGNIDILVNNAGYTNPVPLHQVELDDFERTMAVNVYAPFLFVQHLLRLGNIFKLIVNIGSTAGIDGRSGWLTYSASKAALINMSFVMRQELALYGTRVACISPGRTATALRKVLAPEEDPLTIMQPEDVAEVIFMLTTQVGRFVDCQNLVVRDFR